MIVNIELVLKKVSNVNPMSQLWVKINSIIFKLKLLKFIKLTEIACVQVLGFMEVEQCFIGVHKKQIMKVLDLPFGFMHSILCTKVLHTWELLV